MYVLISDNIPDNVMGENKSWSRVDPKKVIASINHTESQSIVEWKISQVPTVEIEKFLEDVRYIHNIWFSLSFLSSEFALMH
jgi:hypothetical protein